MRTELRVEATLFVHLGAENVTTSTSCRIDWAALENITFAGAPGLGIPLGFLRLRLENGADLAPFDGTLDYGGPSGRSWIDLSHTERLDSFIEEDPGALQNWTGNGTLDFEHFGEGAFWGGSLCTHIELHSLSRFVIELRLDYHWCTELGSPYCHGDGSGATCPCGNPGSRWHGCANSSGSGASLGGSGTPSASADDMLFEGWHLPPQRAALLFAGSGWIALGAGAPFGDGLRCAGGDLRRLGIHLSDSNGIVRHGPGLVARGGLAAGETRFFQLWYRDPAGPCGSGFNLSNGVELMLTP